MEVAARHQDQIDRIKTNVRRAYEYFKPNYDRYNEFRKFVFDSSLTGDEITLLSTLGKPQLEFNVLEAYISRLLGEFSKQEPDIEVDADDPDRADPMIIKMIDYHLRHALTDSSNEHTRYEVYKDLLSGGFSSLKVFTDYANPMSMNQVIKIERCFDPTLCGYDQLARFSHKGDGRFCFELFPMAKEDFEAEYPDIDINQLSYRRDFGGFNWSYLNDQTKTLIVCDYYEKKKKETKIVQLNDKTVITYDKYKEMLNSWSDFAAPPGLIGKPRKTVLERIVRYRCIENQVIEYVDTDFDMLPLIFVDGHSVMIKTPKNGNVHQMTRPYVYHAKGAQRLKNYAGISWANEIENTIQHKFMVAKEALPKEEEFLEAYKDVQKASVLVFNSIYESNPELPINMPVREIQRNPMPQEISQAFVGSDSLIQNILGSYDASLGINNNQLSGVAIVEAATQNNATAMPYIIGYLQGYQRAAQMYVNLMPKYYTTPRTLPIVDKNGQRGYVKINQDEGLQLGDAYDNNEFNVSLKAGASFQVQKSKTINMIKEMMGMSQLFAQFISEKGINFVLDNMEGRGIDQLKSMVDEWTQELQQQKQMTMQAQQQQAMQNPVAMKAQVDMAKMRQDAARDQKQFQIDLMELELKEQKMIADLKTDQDAHAVQILKAQTERFAKEVDLAIAHKDMKHRHAKDLYEHDHMVMDSDRTHELAAKQAHKHSQQSMQEGA